MRLVASLLLGALAWGLGATAGAAATPTGKAAAYFDGLLTRDRATHQTRVRLIQDNVEAWLARWEMIERAQRSIDVTYYVYSDDIFGRSLAGLLQKKARQGVRVRLMVDAFGSKIAGRGRGYLRGLAALDTAEVKIFNPKLRFPRSFRDMIRKMVSANHDKILLVDGHLAMTGGRNVGAHYYASAADGHHTFRDSDILLDGQGIAAEMERAFDEEFGRRFSLEVTAAPRATESDEAAELRLAYHVMRQWMLGTDLTSPPDYPRPELLARLHDEVRAHPALRGQLGAWWERMWEGHRAYPTRILDKHGVDGPKDEITPALVGLIDSAEDSILLQNAYVVLTAEVASALVRASRRGVRITIHTNGPSTSNQPLTQAYFMRDWKKMLRDMPTLRLFAAQGDETLHSKCFVIDDRIASVGSYNLDPLSQDINSEIVAVVDSPDFARQIRLRVERDMASAAEYLVEFDANRVPRRVIRGPEQELEGRALWILRTLGRIPFLRSMI